MNAKNILAIVASIVSVVLLSLAGWTAGGLGILFGLFIVAVVWLRFLSFLGILNLPSLAKNLSWGVIIVGLFSIITLWAVKQIRELESFTSVPTKTSAAAAPAVPSYQLCANNGEYDFSNLDIKKVGKVEFPVRDYCWAKATLPSKDCVTHDPTVEVKRAWDDGTVDIDGPNRIVSSHTGRIIFVKSLQGEGVYKILAQR